MTHSRLILSISVEKNGVPFVVEELHIRDGKWLCIDRNEDIGQVEHPLTYKEAREFAIKHRNNINYSKQQKLALELALLLAFELPTKVDIGGFDEPQYFDPSSWKLVAHIQGDDVLDAFADPSEPFSREDQFLFTSSNVWLLITQRYHFADVFCYDDFSGKTINETEAARLLGINGIELPDVLKPFSVVKHLTPAMLMNHRATTGDGDVELKKENETSFDSREARKPEVPLAERRKVDGESVYAELKGQPARLFSFLLPHLHHVNFDSLRETWNTDQAIFEVAEPTRDAVIQAIKRLNSKLEDHPFKCSVDKNRVKLEYIRS